MLRISQLHGYHRRAPRITSDIVVELSEKRSLYVYSGAAAWVKELKCVVLLAKVHLFTYLGRQ